MTNLPATVLAILFVWAAQVQAQAKPKPTSPKPDLATSAKAKAQSPNAADTEGARSGACAAESVGPRVPHRHGPLPVVVPMWARFSAGDRR